MKQSTYIAFYILVIIIIFNLNGMLFMLVGVEQLMTPLMILCIAVLALNLYPKFMKGLGTLGQIYASVILAYLLIGFIASINSGGELKISYMVTNAISLVTIMCIAAFTFAYFIEHGRTFVNIIFYIVLISTSSIPFSPLLLLIYKIPPAEIARGFGFFANPNEAGIMSVIGLGLLIAVKIPGYLKVIFYFILLANCVLTFSKSSILLFTLVSLVVFITSDFKIKFKYSFIIVGAFIVASYSIPTYYENLEGVQKRRIDQVMAIAFGGEINADTTSSRSELWVIGLQKINQHVLLGNGLGELHNMKGGIIHAGVWQGVHNVFLMLWGEAGVFVLLGFLFFCCSYLFSWFIMRKVMPRELLIFTLVSFICLLMDMMSGHGVLNLRMHNLFLGLSFGCFAYYNHLSKKERLLHR